jgi:hypothetical protein
MTPELAYYSAGYHDRGLPMNATLTESSNLTSSADEVWVRRWADTHGARVSHYSGHSREPYLSVSLTSQTGTSADVTAPTFYFSATAFGDVGEERNLAAFRKLRELLDWREGDATR